MKQPDRRLSLSGLDPGTRNPAYWGWFYRTVMARAGPELARRRGEGTVEVADVVASWSRALVPVALLAAALAGLLLMENRASGPPSRGVLPSPAALEEALLQGVDHRPAPWMAVGVAELDELAFLNGARR